MKIDLNSAKVDPNEALITAGKGLRTLVRIYDTAQGARMVLVVPQYEKKPGDWRPGSTALVFSPFVARMVAVAMVAAATAIDGVPLDPAPTEHDREGSRWP